MRILINGRFVTQKATGVQRVQREFVRAVDRLIADGRWPGVSIRLAVPRTDDDAHVGLGLVNIPVDVVPGGAGHRWEQGALARAARGSALVCLGNGGPISSLFRREPTAVMIHDLAYRLFPEDYSTSYRLFHQVADAFILRKARPLLTVSETEAVNIRRASGGTTRVVVASNGGCADDVMPEPSARPAEGSLLYVGAFSERKNIAAVVSAATQVARLRGVGTDLVGPPNDEAAALAAGVPDELRHLVRFRGFVDDATLESLYRNALALLYPSAYEASGLPPTEAMAYGCPVLASDIPVLHERCGDAALFCSLDAGDVLRAALRLVDEPALRAALSAMGPVRAATFTWRRQAEIVIDAVLSA